MPQAIHKILLHRLKGRVEVHRRTNLVSSNDTWPDSSSTMILQWSPDTNLLPGKDKSQP